ncbi:MAG: hypothetical protein ACP5OA_03545, partial [Candidatus Woesearchaeota archaeon]
LSLVPSIALFVWIMGVSMVLKNPGTAQYYRLSFGSAFTSLAFLLIVSFYIQFFRAIGSEPNFFASYVSIIISMVGIIFGIITLQNAIKNDKNRIWWPICGIILCLKVMALAIWMMHE